MINLDLQEHSVVRVKALILHSRGNMTTTEPKIGDTGTIVHIFTVRPTTIYTVKNCDKEGRAVWLADFTHDELERIS